MTYVLIVKSWEKGARENSSFIATTAYGPFETGDAARAFVSPLTVDAHFDTESEVWPLTLPSSPVPSADSPEGRAAICAALASGQQWGGRST